MLIDTHCHLHRAALSGTLENWLIEASETGVGQLITVGTDREDWEVYAGIADAIRNVSYTIGLHPCSVGPDAAAHIETIPDYWNRSVRPVALGEIGLDAFHLPKDTETAQRLFEAQKNAFRRQLEIAASLDCPVIIHSRSAVTECIRIIDESGIDWSKVVFHCFSDGPQLLEPILSRGGRASFTGIITFKSAQEVRDALARQGIGRLMVETDAPYLAPVPFRGKECRPAMVAHTAGKAAEVLGLSPEELARQTTVNAMEFFRLQEGNCINADA